MKKNIIADTEVGSLPLRPRYTVEQEPVDPRPHMAPLAAWFYQGRAAAALRNGRVEANPYPAGSIAGRAWKRGFKSIKVEA